MKIRSKPLSIAASPSGHALVAQEAQREIDRIQSEIADTQRIHAEQEAKLQALSPRYDERQTRKNAAYLAVEAAQQAYDDCACYADLAKHGSANQQATTDFLAAEQALISARSAMRKTLAAIEAEEERDNDEASLSQGCLTSAQRKLAKLDKELARLVGARDKALESHGKHLHKTVDLQLQALSDQRAAAQATLADIEAQQKAAVEAARATLQDYPEHLVALLNKHVVYEDDAARLVAANIAWRKALLQAGPGLPIASLISTAQLNAIWLHVDPDTRPDWMQLDLEDISKWLSVYRERH